MPRLLPALLALLLPGLLPAATERLGTAADEGLTPSASAAADEDEAYRERLRRLRELRDEVREERLRRRSEQGAARGWAVSMGYCLSESFSGHTYAALPSSILLDLNVERALSDHFSARLGVAWSPVEPGSTVSEVVWAGRLQLRNYPFRMGRLNGFFMGLGTDFTEVRQFVGSAWDSGAGHSRDLFRYGHGFGLGPTVGYQWVLGRVVVLGLEGNYRYHWVEVPDDAEYLDISDSSSVQGDGTHTTASTLDARMTVGWAF